MAVRTLQRFNWLHVRKIGILIVEDEALIRMDMADALLHAGFNVFEADNSDEAIKILGAEKSIRLVLTDVDMPGSMDGLKLAAAVRNRWPPVHLIIVSGRRFYWSG